MLFGWSLPISSPVPKGESLIWLAEPLAPGEAPYMAFRGELFSLTTLSAPNNPQPLRGKYQPLDTAIYPLLSKQVRAGQKPALHFLLSISAKLLVNQHRSLSLCNPRRDIYTKFLHKLQLLSSRWLTILNFSFFPDLFHPSIF